MENYVPLHESRSILCRQSVGKLAWIVYNYTSTLHIGDRVGSSDMSLGLLTRELLTFSTKTTSTSGRP